ncbi:MAG: NDP-sugar synthase [Myxococcales bacterium]|nr:NDP-sugar synthase [Myxococcales bacterium]
MRGVFGTPLRAMVLCAGMGTRLGPLSQERPKPLLPVCDYPLVRYALSLLAGYQIRDVVINLHHLGEQIEAELGDGHDLGMNIVYSREEEILGTGGGLRRVAAHLTHNGHEPCIVINGKIVIDVDLESVMALHRITGAVATMVLYETPDADAWGAIEVGRDGRVQRMLGQEAPRVSRRERLTKCMFTGVHILEPALLARLPHGRGCVIRQGYLPALREGEPISGYIVSGYFHEHSTRERLLQGNIHVLRERAALKFPPGPLCGVSPTAQIHPGAEIIPPVRIADGAEIGRGAVVGPDVVVGRGAQVSAGVRLDSAVVFAGAKVNASLSGGIITPRSIYPVSLDMLTPRGSHERR